MYIQKYVVHIELLGDVEQNDGIRLSHIWMYRVMDSPEGYISIPLLLETNIYSWGKWLLYSVKLCANVCIVEGGLHGLHVAGSPRWRVSCRASDVEGSPSKHEPLH